MRVSVDGGTPMDIDASGSAGWVERVIATNLNPAVGHQILVEKNAGKASGFGNANYKKAGAEIVDSPKDIFKQP